MGDFADRRIACGIGMFEGPFLEPIVHGKPTVLGERKFACAFGSQRAGPRRHRKRRRFRVRPRVGVQFELVCGWVWVAPERLRRIDGQR